MSDETGTGLPASIEAAWGIRERGRSGRRMLTLDRICEAGITLADRDGLAAVSMARVAGELGVSTMALYRHVASKDELLVVMADAALGDPPVAATAEEGWRAGVSRWAWRELDVLRQRPWLLHVMFKAPPMTPNNIRWLEQNLRSLHATGLSENEKVSTSLLVSGFVVNWATLTAEVAATVRAKGGDPTRAFADYGRQLSMLVDPERFPAVSRAIAAGAFDDDPAESKDAEFQFGLDRVLDGVEMLVHARA